MKEKKMTVRENNCRHVSVTKFTKCTAAFSERTNKNSEGKIL